MFRTELRFRTVLALCFILCFAAWSFAQTEKPPRWPRTIDDPRGTVTVYSPQLESIQGDRLTAVSAVSVKLKTSPEPVFGAVWFNCRVSTDRATQEVSFSDLKVPVAKFPDTPDDKVTILRQFLEQNLPISDIKMPMASLVAQVNLVAEKRQVSGKFEDKPPQIVFVMKPTALVFINGEPKMKKVEGSGLMRVVNTPYLIVFDSASSSYYLKGGDFWYSASDWKGPWNPDAKPPQDALKLASNDFLTTQTQKETPKGELGEPAPEIFVTTSSTELIETTGEPQFVPISGSKLTYVSNTERSWIYDTASQTNYVLLAGRWYAGPSTRGPWQYTPGRSLPEDFKKIPADSVAGAALANVPGTQEASNALANLQVPQTAAIDRREAKFTPTYDGAPQFKPIEGTNLSYAANSPQTIIKTPEGRTYANEDAVWYESTQPTAAFEVSTSVPQSIYSIPPSSPVYNATYSYVYDSTPDTVYVGYTPGYTGSYYHDDCICYGTGYDYPYWYGDYYYSSPYTWGLGAAYNPYTDNWGVRFGYGGRFGGYGGGWVGWGSGWYGGWVAGGYWHGGAHVNPLWRNQGNLDNRWDNRYQNNIYDRAKNFNRNDFDFNRNNINAGNNRWKDKAGNIGRAGGIAAAGGIGAAGGIAAAGAIKSLRGGAANRPGRAATLPAGAGNRLPSRDGRGPDNVFADQNGNVFRNTGKGWEQRVGNGWQNANDRVPGGAGAALAAGAGAGLAAGAGQNLGNRVPGQGAGAGIQQRPGGQLGAGAGLQPGAGAGLPQRPGVQPGAGTGLPARPSVQPGAGMPARPALPPRPSISQPSMPSRPTYNLPQQSQARQQAVQRSQAYQRPPSRTTSQPRRSSSASRPSGGSRAPSRSASRPSGGSRGGGGGRASGGARAGGGGGGRGGGRR